MKKVVFATFHWHSQHLQHYQIYMHRGIIINAHWNSPDRIPSELFKTCILKIVHPCIFSQICRTIFFIIYTNDLNQIVIIFYINAWPIFFQISRVGHIIWEKFTFLVRIYIFCQMSKWIMAESQSLRINQADFILPWSSTFSIKIIV